MTPFRRLRAALALSMLAASAVLATPGAALADCMAPPPVEEAIETSDIVLVGTVTETANENRWATVAVEEIWRGPDVPATLQIRGGPGPGAGSSIDRTFEVGKRYLLFPYVEVDAEPLPIGPAGGLVDNSCTSTQPWDDSMAALRPADARTGEVDMRADAVTIDLGGIVVLGGAVLLLVAVMLGVGLLARGRSD